MSCHKEGKEAHYRIHNLLTELNSSSGIRLWCKRFDESGPFFGSCHLIEKLDNSRDRIVVIHWLVSNGIRH